LVINVAWAFWITGISVWGTDVRTGFRAPKALAYLDAVFSVTIVPAGWFIEDVVAARQGPPATG
jgi:hypothetical protein